MLNYEASLSRRTFIGCFTSLFLVASSGCTALLGKRTDIKLVNGLDRTRTVRVVATPVGADDPAFEETYEIDPNTAVRERNALGWRKYNVQLEIDGTVTGMNETTISEPQCLSPVLVAHLVDADYYADFEYKCS